MGGVGKSSLAAEYAHRRLADVGLAWQVRCEDPAVLASDMAELAAQVGAQELADLRDPIASAHAVLATYRSQWLVIFDNAPDEASILQFLPPAGPGQILITSQSPHWRTVQVLNVPLLQEEVAARFLVNRTAEQDWATARELAGNLGGLPLALEQAAAYIGASGLTLTRYLGLLRRRRAQLLAKGEPAGHPATVAATLGLALARLEQHSPAAAGLLRLLACMAPEPIPLDLLLADPGLAARLAQEVAAVGPLIGDLLAISDAIAALRRYSLATLVGDQRVQVHGLVQAVALDQAGPERAASWREAAATLILAAMPDLRTWLRSAKDFVPLLVHLGRVLGAEDPDTAGIAMTLGMAGSYQAARDLSRDILAVRMRDKGPEHDDTMGMRTNLASWTALAGEPDKARDLYLEQLSIEQRVLGGDHPDTLFTRWELADCTGKAGDPAGARDQFAELLRDTERIFAAEHATTLSTRRELAHWTGKAGDPAGARDQFAELLCDTERIFGAEHKNTLVTRMDLSGWIGEAGDAAQARRMLSELSHVAARVLGPQDRLARATRRELGYWAHKAGKKRKGHVPRPEEP